MTKTEMNLETLVLGDNNFSEIPEVTVKEVVTNAITNKDKVPLDTSIPPWLKEDTRPKKVGRPRKNSSSKYEPAHLKILSLDESAIDDKTLNRYQAVSEYVIMFLDLFYQGANRTDAFLLAKNKFGKKIPSKKQIADSIYKLLHQPQSLAYLQLLKEGIINLFYLKGNYPQIKYNTKEFETVNLCYSPSVEAAEWQKLIRFYRKVILKRIIKGQIVAENEEESLRSELGRSVIGTDFELKKLLWKKINSSSNPSPQLVKNYMDLCGMTDSKQQLDQKIEISFTDFNATNPKLIPKEDINVTK